MANMAKRFYDYCTRVYRLDQLFEKIDDGRINPTYQLPSLLAKTMAGIVTAKPSLNQLEKTVKNGCFDKVGGKVKPKAETFKYALEKVNCSNLTASNDEIIAKARRNKALGKTTVEGYRVVAVDGTGLFSTYSERLGKESHFRKGVHGEDIREPIYLEHALGISYVGESGPNLMLDLVRIPKGKGETTVAIEVLRDMYHRHYRYADIITVDALYAKAPFINEVLAQNKDIVVRVKQQCYDIIKDAKALFEQRSPDVTHNKVKLRQKQDTHYDLEIWDEENFTSWDNVKKPLRCIQVRETRRTVDSRGEVIKEETNTTHFVTSCPKAIVPALTVWKIAHRRWDIENTGFHFLKHHFKLNHAYGYDSNLVEAMLKLFVMTFNLFQLFVKRNLRSFDAKRDTLLEIIQSIHDGLVVLAYLRGRVPDLLLDNGG